MKDSISTRVFIYMLVVTIVGIILGGIIVGTLSTDTDTIVLEGSIELREGCKDNELLKWDETFDDWACVRLLER